MKNMQLVKMVLGFLTSLALIALVAFSKVLGHDFGPKMQMMLLGLAVGGGAIGAHGAWKSPPPPGGGQ